MPFLFYLSFTTAVSIFTKGNEVGSFEHVQVVLLPSDFIGQMRKMPKHLSQNERPWTEGGKLGI